jgi:NodT family efflux transporter outer membrane factor (OMF) lipoprotein
MRFYSYFYHFFYICFYIYGLLAIAMGLSGCVVGPDFTPPAAPTEESYTAESNLNPLGSQRIHPNKPISAFWWREFDVPELNRVIAQGIQNNYTLVSMRETLSQAQEQVNALSGQRWPQIALTTAAGRQKYGAALFGPSPLSIPPFTYYEIGPGVAYTPDLFGSTARSIEKQEALAGYQAQVFNATYLSLTGNLVTTALAIARIHAERETLHEMILGDKQYVKLIQKAFHLGALAQTEVLTAKSQLITDEIVLPGLDQQLTLAHNALNRLVGRTPVEWQPPHFQLKQFRLPQELPLRIPSVLVRARPDILAAEALLHAASADVGIATANLYPAMTLSAATLQEALTPATVFQASANTWSYLGTLTTPLFNGGMLRAQRRAALHAYQSAYAHYQQVVLNAFVEVSNVLHALKQDAEAEQLQRKAMITARAALKLARLSYKAGSVGILEVLAAERFYRQAQLGYIKAQGQRYEEIVQLYLVLGGGENLINALRVPA